MKNTGWTPDIMIHNLLVDKRDAIHKIDTKLKVYKAIKDDVPIRLNGHSTSLSQIDDIISDLSWAFPGRNFVLRVVRVAEDYIDNGNKKRGLKLYAWIRDIGNK